MVDHRKSGASPLERDTSMVVSHQIDWIRIYRETCRTCARYGDTMPAAMQRICEDYTEQRSRLTDGLLLAYRITACLKG